MGKIWADGTQMEEDDVRGRWGGECVVVVLRLEGGEIQGTQGSRV